MIAVDVSSELNDLLRVYSEAEVELLKREKCALETLEMYMKRYMNIRDERNKISEKLKILKGKLNSTKTPDQECDCEEDEE